MDHFIQIYKSQADAYHRAIAAEDVDGNLLPALGNITDLRGTHVLDLGTGTGRLPILLNGLAAQIIGLDLREGLFTRAERVLVLSGGLIIDQVTPMLWILAVLASATAAQRLLIVWIRAGRQQE